MIKENKMTISFTSTYGVPLKQTGIQGITPAKKNAVKALAQVHGGIVPASSSTGKARFSVPPELDAKVQAELKKLGFKKYTTVPTHEVPNNKLDTIINEFERSQKTESKMAKRAKHNSKK